LSTLRAYAQQQWQPDSSFATRCIGLAQMAPNLLELLPFLSQRGAQLVSSPCSVQFKPFVEKEKEKLEKIRGHLREADAARREGNYQVAIAAARKSFKVDKNNSKGMLLVNLLTKEAAEAEKKAEVRNF